LRRHYLGQGGVGRVLSSLTWCCKEGAGLERKTELVGVVMLRCIEVLETKVMREHVDVGGLECE